jgi:hypothetical protein
MKNVVLALGVGAALAVAGCEDGKQAVEQKAAAEKATAEKTAAEKTAAEKAAAGKAAAEKAAVKAAKEPSSPGNTPKGGPAKPAGGGVAEESSNLPW